MTLTTDKRTILLFTTLFLLTFAFIGMYFLNSRGQNYTPTTPVNVSNNVADSTAAKVYHDELWQRLRGMDVFLSYWDYRSNKVEAEATLHEGLEIPEEVEEYIEENPVPANVRGVDKLHAAVRTWAKKQEQLMEVEYMSLLELVENDKTIKADNRNAFEVRTQKLQKLRFSLKDEIEDALVEFRNINGF